MIGVKMIGTESYVLIAVLIVVVENFKNRFGYTNSRSIIWHDKNNFCWRVALPFRG